MGQDGCEISVLLTDNCEIKELNRQYRDIDKATDVLSFPTEDKDIIGDVVVSVEKAVEQAEVQGVSFTEEMARLLTHGILHLFGYDHEKSVVKARKMRLEEERLMALYKSKDDLFLT